MLKQTKYNLTHLLDFSGRDARSTFWFYVLFLFLLNIALGMVLGVVMVGSMVSAMIDAADAGLSEQAMQARMTAGMGDFMGTIVWYSLATNVVMCLLLAASFVRRLHDSNSSGLWALVVLAAQVAGFVVSVQVFGQMQQLMGEMFSNPEMTPQAMQGMMLRQQQIGGYGLVGWIGPLIVIVFGVMDSSDGPNRFGEASVRFE